METQAREVIENAKRKMATMKATVSAGGNTFDKYIQQIRLTTTIASSKLEDLINEDVGRLTQHALTLETNQDSDCKSSILNAYAIGMLVKAVMVKENIDDDDVRIATTMLKINDQESEYKYRFREKVGDSRWFLLACPRTWDRSSQDPELMGIKQLFAYDAFEDVWDELGAGNIFKDPTTPTRSSSS